MLKQKNELSLVVLLGDKREECGLESENSALPVQRVTDSWLMPGDTGPRNLETPIAEAGLDNSLIREETGIGKFSSSTIGIVKTLQKISFYIVTKESEHIMFERVKGATD